MLWGVSVGGGKDNTNTLKSKSFTLTPFLKITHVQISGLTNFFFPLIYFDEVFYRCNLN